MKSKIILILLLLFCKILVFTQDTITKHSYIQISINISMPTDYNIRKMQPITSEVYPGYSFYNKLGGAFTIEYLKKIKSKLFLKAGFNFTQTSLLITAKGNETFILNLNYQRLFEMNDYRIVGGVFVGSEYQLSTKSAFFLNISPDLFHLSIEKSLYFDDSKSNNTRLLTDNFFETIRFKVGYSYQLYKKFKVFISTAFFSDNLTTPYLGIGLKYNFKIR